MSNVKKPHLLPYDDDYVLVSKRRLAASNDCVAAMAIQLSALINKSHLYLINLFVIESIKTVDNWSQERLDKHIKEIIDFYNQDPKKSA